MGSTYYPQLLGARVLHDDGTVLSTADNQSRTVDITGVDGKIILACCIGYNGKDTAASAYRIDWRTPPTSGTFNELSNTGSNPRYSATSAGIGTDDAALATASFKCSGDAANESVQTGLVNVGDNRLPDGTGTFDLGSDSYSELWFAVDMTQCSEGTTYEFRLFNITANAATGTLGCTVRIAKHNAQEVAGATTPSGIITTRLNRVVSGILTATPGNVSAKTNRVVNINGVLTAPSGIITTTTKFNKAVDGTLTAPSGTATTKAVFRRTANGVLTAPSGDKTVTAWLNKGLSLSGLPLSASCQPTYIEGAGAPKEQIIEHGFPSASAEITRDVKRGVAGTFDGSGVITVNAKRTKSINKALPSPSGTRTIDLDKSLLRNFLLSGGCIPTHISVVSVIGEATSDGSIVIETSKSLSRDLLISGECDRRVSYNVNLGHDISQSGKLDLVTYRELLRDFALSGNCEPEYQQAGVNDVFVNGELKYSGDRNVAVDRSLSANMSFSSESDQINTTQEAADYVVVFCRRRGRR